MSVKDHSRLLSPCVGAACRPWPTSHITDTKTVCQRLAHQHAKRNFGCSFVQVFWHRVDTNATQGMACAQPAVCRPARRHGLEGADLSYGVRALFPFFKICFWGSGDGEIEACRAGAAPAEATVSSPLRLNARIDAQLLACNVCINLSGPTGTPGVSQCSTFCRDWTRSSMRLSAREIRS